MIIIIDEAEEAEPIDFTWFYFIGRAKLNLTDKEVGRLTITTFNRLYGHYKDNFDIEMRMRLANVTYSELYEQEQKSEEWLNIGFFSDVISLI